METNKDKKELSAEELAPNSLAYDLAKSKQTKNLLGSIRKETRGILRVVNAWKIEDVSKLQLKLQRDADRFTKLKERVGTRRKKRKPTEDDRGPEERKPEEKKPQDKKPEDKKPEEKKPQEKRPSPEEDAKRKADFEKERATRYRQLRERGVPPEEAKRRAYDDTVSAQKYKPEITAEPPKPKPTGGFKLPELPKLNLPKINIPKPQLPKLKLPDLNPEQLSRQAGLNKLVGKIFDIKDVFDLGTSAAKGDVAGVTSSAAGLLSNFKKFGPLAYFDAYKKAAEGDVTGAAESAAITRASGSLISRLTGMLSKVKVSPNVATKGFTGIRTLGAGFLLDYISDQTLGKYLKQRESDTVKQTIEKIQGYSPEKQAEVISKIESEIKREKSWQSGWGGGYDKIMNFLTMQEYSQSEKALKLREEVLKGLKDKKTPKMAEGGVVTQPTLAIIGEGGEKEYIVPESKLSEFIAAQSQNNDAVRKPARMILGVVDNFISQFGSSSGDIRRMVGGDLLRLERIYGKDRFVLPVFTRGEGSFDNIIADSFKKLIGTGGGGISDQLYDAIANLLVSVDSFMGMAGGGQFGGISGPSGPVPQGTNADFWTLAAIASLESSNPEGQADVAQSVYNRLASGVYSGNTIKDLILAEKQYSPVGESDGNLWRQIVDRQTAIVAVRSHPRGQNAETMVDDAARNITNPQLQESARQFVGGRTDFAVPTAAAIQPGGIADRTRHGHLFGWYVGGGAISYGRTNPGPTPIPNFQGITTTQQPPTGTTPRTTTQQTQPSSGLQRVQSEKRPKNGEFVFEPTPGFSKYKIKVSNGRIVSAIDMGNNYSTAPSLIQPYWNEGVGNLYTSSSARQTTTTTTTTTTSQPPQTSQRATFITGLIMPTRGAITSTIGMRWGRPHNGIDIGAPTGTPVVAPESGKVVYAKFNDGGFGNLVIIQGSKGFHYLAHLNRILTTEGATVSANQIVGEVGETGRSTGPHLHWEIRSNASFGGNVINPLTLNPVNADGSPIPASMAPRISSSTSISPATRNLYRRTVERAFQRNPQLNRALQRRSWRSLSSPTPLSQGGSVVAIQPVIIQQPSPSSPSNVATQQTSTEIAFAYRNPVYPSFG